MTIQAIVMPATVAAGVTLYAWIMTLLPPEVSLGLRAANGFALILLLVAYQRRFDRRLSEVIDIVKVTEIRRSKAVAALEVKTDALAAAVARATEARQAANETALVNQTETLVAKIEEGTTASREAQREANSVNQKIADLDKRLLDAIPPKDQIDDIQTVSHESRDILTSVEKKVGP